MIMRVVSIFVATLGIVAFVSKGAARTGVDAGSATVAEVYSNIGITVVTAHQPSIGEQKSDAGPCAIFACEEPPATPYNTFARSGKHACQFDVGEW